jgi:hypothetical protein
MIIEDGKSENGVTNTKNMARSYSSSYRSGNAYIYMNFTQKNQQAAEKRNK